MGGSQPRFLFVSTTPGQETYALEGAQNASKAPVIFKPMDSGSRFQKMLFNADRDGLKIRMDSHPQHYIGVSMNEGKPVLEVDGEYKGWEMLVTREKDSGPYAEWRGAETNWMNADDAEGKVFLVMLKNRGTNLFLMSGPTGPELKPLPVRTIADLEPNTVGPFFWQMPYVTRQLSAGEVALVSGVPVGAVVSIGAASVATIVATQTGSTSAGGGSAGVAAGRANHAGAQVGTDYVQVPAGVPGGFLANLGQNLVLIGQALQKNFQKGTWGAYFAGLIGL